MADRHSEELRTFSHLAGLLAEDFPPEVLDRRLRIVVGDGVLENDAGQVLVLTIARLAPRFCHRIDFVSPAQPCRPRLKYLLGSGRFESRSLAELGQLIWPDGDFTADGGGDVDVVVGVGAPGDIGVGIDRDGAAIVVVDDGVGVDRGDTLFAALVAAALSCAQVAKRLYPEIRGGSLDKLLRFDRPQPDSSIRRHHTSSTVPPWLGSARSAAPSSTP